MEGEGWLGHLIVEDGVQGRSMQRRFNGARGAMVSGGLRPSRERAGCDVMFMSSDMHLDKRRRQGRTRRGPVPDVWVRGSSMGRGGCRDGGFMIPG